MEPQKRAYNIKSQQLADRVIRFIGSDESIDRDGDTLAVDGWDIKNYMANPIVLFGHKSWDFPVGKTQSITIDSRMKQLVFDIRFPTIEELATNPKTPSEQALTVDAIYCMAKSGLLNAVSVGFKPIDYINTETGRKYIKQELLEISIVPIPANPNALAVLRSANVSDTVIKGLNMDTVEKGGARLSAESKERLSKIKAKFDVVLAGCNDAMKEIDDFMNPPEPEPVTEQPPPEKQAGKPVEKSFIIDIVGSTPTKTNKE